MAWINPLDRLPQIRQDYANHMLWAAFGWLAIMLVYPHPHIALVIMSIVGAVKKIVDYAMADTPERRAAETWQVCVLKTIVTASGACLPWLGWVMGNL